MTTYIFTHGEGRRERTHTQREGEESERATHIVKETEIVIH